MRPSGVYFLDSTWYSSRDNYYHFVRFIFRKRFADSRGLAGTVIHWTRKTVVYGLFIVLLLIFRTTWPIILHHQRSASKSRFRLTSIYCPLMLWILIRQNVPVLLEQFFTLQGLVTRTFCGFSLRNQSRNFRKVAPHWMEKMDEGRWLTPAHYRRCGFLGNYDCILEKFYLIQSNPHILLTLPNFLLMRVLSNHALTHAPYITFLRKGLSVLNGSLILCRNHFAFPAGKLCRICHQLWWSKNRLPILWQIQQQTTKS